MNHRLFYLRHLPHWQPPEAIFFITFRLAGSLPFEVIETLQREQAIERQNQAKILDEGQLLEQIYLDERKAFGRWDAALDNAVSSPRWLVQPQIAAIVADALRHYDGLAYDLFAFCIMPNHVHFVSTLCPTNNPANPSDFSNKPIDDQKYLPLSRIMQSLKGYTARQANKTLGRKGAFWQQESYDHVVRDAAEFERIIFYILNNPVKAGLAVNWQDWQWSYCKKD